MALSILDGNQSATTLSTILSSGQHITAHTVVSLGTQAITDMRGAVSGSVVLVSSLPAISGTVTANAGNGFTNAVAVGLSDFISDEGVMPISGTINSNILVYNAQTDDAKEVRGYSNGGIGVCLEVCGPSNNSVTIGGMPAVPVFGTVTASISGTVPISISSVTIGNSVTIGSLPLISGTVTVGNSITIGQITSLQGQNLLGSQGVFSTLRIKDSAGSYGEPAGSGINTYNLPVYGSVTLGAGTAQIGSVTVGNSVTIGSLPAISGTVTASISSFATSVTARLINPAGTAVTYAEVGTAGSPSIDVLSVQGVSGGTSLLIGGTTGSFTTRFGSVTTANTAQISTAVTNLSRKYLFVQNVTTSSNVITVGIGFTPTTTQGIQLAAGALIDFQSSFIPTGAVYILSSVTGSPFTILEA